MSRPAIRRTAAPLVVLFSASARAQEPTVVDLQAAATDAFDFFGSDLTLLDDLLFVGALQADRSVEQGGGARGGIYVFRDTGVGPFAGYQEEIKLISTPPVDASGEYGAAVAACTVPGGDTFVVGGAPFDWAPGPTDSEFDDIIRAGAAYVHRRDAATGLWQQDTRLTRAEPGEYDYDGAAVALACDRDASGAPVVEAFVLTEGFDVWRRAPDGTWEIRQTLPGGSSFPTFLLLDSIVTAARGTRGGTTLAKGGGVDAVSVYRRTGPEAAPWQPEATLSSPLTGPNESFGFSLDIDGDMLIVGTEYSASQPSDVGGRAHVYRYTAAGGWQEDGVLESEVPRVRFGSLVTVWAGPAGDGVGARAAVRSSGGVTTFSRSASGAWTREQLFEQPDERPWPWGGILADIDERFLYFGDAGSADRGENSGVVNLLDPAWAVSGEARPPGGDAVLSLAGPNPARAQTALAVTLPAPASVRLDLYDGRGRRVAVLHDGALPAGRTRVAVPLAGLPPGVYHARLGGLDAPAVVPVVVVR